MTLTSSLLSCVKCFLTNREDTARPILSSTTSRQNFHLSVSDDLAPAGVKNNFTLIYFGEETLFSPRAERQSQTLTALNIIILYKKWRNGITWNIFVGHIEPFSTWHVFHILGFWRSCFANFTEKFPAAWYNQPPNYMILPFCTASNSSAATL